MKYLITGITGFVGPHLANLLVEEGHEVYGLVRHSNGRETDITDVVPYDVFKEIKFIYSDISNFRTLSKVFKEHQFDGVFHLAAQSHPPTSFADPLGTINDNVVGSANIIQCIEDYCPDAKLMFCSTSEVYGNVGIDKRAIKTTDQILPANPYGASKAATDIYLQERFENKKINGFITRAFSHTGPRRGRTFSISSDAYQIARMMNGDQDSRSLLVGNLESVRVVLDVRDMVQAYHLLMTNEGSSGNIYNVCGTEPHEMGHFTDLLIKHSGLTDIRKTVHPPFYRPIDIHYQCGDSAPVKELTGWEPKRDLNSTMSDLLEYWVNKLRR
jgi:GDPmannose 4,6-dehydratase|tara:strand:+ start:3290 stop:4273 length:984 start_codon:yes stop_codon:yes gene_type:complete